MPLANVLKQLFRVEPLIAKQATPSVNVMSYWESVGTVESPIRIRKKGRICLCGIYWFARSNSDRIIAIAEEVRVVAREGITLIVEPINTPEQLPLSWPEDKFPKSC